MIHLPWKKKKSIKTGLYDSGGKEIKVGDKIKIPVTKNKNLYGEWAIYEVILVGIVPILLYVKSQKGKVIKKETSLAVFLSDKYPSTELLFAKDTRDIKPKDDLVIIEGGQ